MSEEKLLAEFEAWWESDGRYCRAGGGDYEKTFAWRAWQASRAALCVELPDTWSPNDCGDWAYWADAVDAAIKAAGVRVKE